MRAGKAVISIIGLALAGSSGAPLWGQQPADSPSGLIRDIAYNELHDRDRDSHWQYRSERRTPDQNVVREQIETAAGPVFRVLARDGAPLDPAQQQREQQRLDEYVHHPADIARAEGDHEEDEARIATVLQMLPRAFLFNWDGPPAGDLVRMTFRPNPAFVPSGYEARILHAVSGTLTANLRYKRLIDIHGAVDERVDFGYGLLGHVDKGSSFEVHREQVSPTHWKADLIAAHIEGKLLLFKTVSRDQREVRSDFRPVPINTTPAQAEGWLIGARGETDHASARTADPAEAELPTSAGSQR